MSFLSLFRKAAPPVETKASKAFAVHMTGAAAAWSKREYISFVQEAYRKNVVAFQAVNKLATAVSSIEWEAWRDDKQLTAHPIIDLLKKPNQLQTGADWWRARVTYLFLSGNSYDERVTGDRGNKLPLELWTLRPDRVTIMKSSAGVPAGFEYKVGNKAAQFPADTISGDSDILHTKLFNPVDDWYGMSPVEAAAYAVDQHNEAMTWMQSLLQNAARPSGALVVGKDTALSDEEYNRMVTELEQRYSGAQNAGRPMLLEGGLDWKPMGFSPVDMEILRIKDSAARDISLAFGVPPLLLNIPGDNTYANYREARLGFYEDTILPLVNFLAGHISNWIGPAFGGVEIRPNKDKIEAIADKRIKLWEMADNSMELTVNEARGLKGYPPLPSPLGTQLMAELKKSQKAAEPTPAPDAEMLKRLAYGNG